MYGFYINLEHRIDRREHVENMKEQIPFFKDIHRMEAVLNIRGDIGCSMSHIKCLTELKKKKNDHYLIIEDDFFIFNIVNFNSFIKEFDKIKTDDDWDIITLTPRGDTKEKNYKNNFHRIINNQTTTGYIIKHRFIDTLISVYKNGVINLLKNNSPGVFALDQCWKPLQLQSNFIYYSKIYGGQLPCYSDIENKVVDYNQRFLDQLKY